MKNKFLRQWSFLLVSSRMFCFRMCYMGAWNYQVVTSTLQISVYSHSAGTENGHFLANMEVSEQTDWDWREPSNKSNDQTTLNIRCHFIWYNLNMLTKLIVLHLKLLLLLLLPDTIIQILAFHVPTFVIETWSYGCSSILLEVLEMDCFKWPQTPFSSH